MNSALRIKSRIIAGAAAVGIAASAGLLANSTSLTPVLADPVRVEAPAAPSFADAVEKVSPAVVSVRVKAKIEPASDRGMGNFFGGEGFDFLPDDHPLKRFFDQGPRGNREFRNAPRRGQGRERPVSQGSGFFISEDGYLVTNNHVIENGTQFTVIMDDGTELEAKLVGADPRTDLAVLKVEEARKFTYVAFADDKKVRVGDWVVAVGNPFGLGGSVTAGIISARGRDIGAGPYDDFLQIDAAVNRGNSGGPAFNLNGEVVGINTAIFSPSGGNVGIAFAIPASLANDVVTDLIDDGSIERGWLGVQIQPVTKDIAESLGLADAEGALVSEPQDGSPAEKAGIKSGDIVTSVDGEKIESPKELARVIASIPPGNKAEIGLWRAGKAETVTLKIGTLPDLEKKASKSRITPNERTELGDTGLTLEEIDGGLVVTAVDPDSDAADRGINEGDVIVTVNSEPVSSVSDVEDAIASAEKAGRKAVLFQIQRDNNNRFVALPVARG